ncbi:warA [Symbiodinium sp. CCMP2592]|nr:warA [Symbiodinium sp. CCMP2592]
MALPASDVHVASAGAQGSRERPVPLSADHWQQVDEALDVLVGVLKAGHTKDANMLAAELRCHLLSLQRNDQLWQEELEENKRSVADLRQELRHTTGKLDEVVQELKEADANKIRAEVELKTISQKTLESKEDQVRIQSKRQQLLAEQERLETQRLQQEEMRRLAALEERRQEAARQEERQRLAELQRLQHEAEEKLRREELEKRLESIRRQEEEKERRAAAMQQEELRQKEAEQHRSQLQQQGLQNSGCDEMNRDEQLEQVEQDQENQEGRNGEEVPQQSGEDLPEDAARAGPCAHEEHCNQSELDMKREKVEDLDSHKEGTCKTQVLEQEPSARQSQQEEIQKGSMKTTEPQVQDHDCKENPLQEPALCPGAIELPRVALHGFQPVPVKLLEAPEKEIIPDASPEDGCSDLTEIDATTEPLHSDDQSQPSQAEQTEQAEPEVAPAEPLQVKEPKRPLCSPDMMWGHDRERHRGELFLELGRRLGRTDQDQRAPGEAPSKAAVEAPSASAASAASASLVAAEAALRAAAQQRMASVQHLAKGPTCVQTLCAPVTVPRPQDQEACRNATAGVSLNKGQIPTIARSLSPVRIVASGRPFPRVLVAPAEGQAPLCMHTDSAQAVGVASGTVWQPVQAGVLTARGVPVQKECTQPNRGLSPVPMRFRSLVVPAATHHPAQGSTDCHVQATAGDRSCALVGTWAREMPGIGLARYPQAENMIPVFRPQKIASQSGSVQAPVSQQVELLRQMPGSPVYAARQLPLAGSFVAPAARPILEPWPGRPVHEVPVPQRAVSPVRQVRWPRHQAADATRSCEGQPGRASFQLMDEMPVPEVPHRAASPLRPARWLHTADPSFSCDSDAGRANGERPEETPRGCVARLADHVRRFPQTVQTISGGTVRNVTMEPVDVPKKSLGLIRSPRHSQLLHLTRLVVSIAMGSRCCTPEPEPIPGSYDPDSCSAMVHPCLFPMYVVKVSDFLQMEGPPQAHDALMDQGLLHEWHPGMFVVFISHQWIGAGHPDPSGTQTAALRGAVSSFIDGSLQVEPDLISMDISTIWTTYSCEEIANGYIFFDWFAIPQITARKQGVNENVTKSDAALAVQSIPAYVEVSDLFIALVPELTHAQTRKPCNYTSWLSRGWCRAELWCRLLSNKRNTSVIVVYSAREAQFIFPLDWQQNLIADGQFTVESDREAVVQLGEMAVESKIQHLAVEGPLKGYRFYKAMRNKLLGQPRQDLSLDAFLSSFNFESVEAAINDDSGMDGMATAVFGGAVNILRRLVEKRGDPNRRMRGMGELGYYDTQTLLMVAAKSSQPADVLSTLIELHADPCAVSRSGINCAFLARSPGHVKVLLEARMDVSSSFEVHGACSFAGPSTVKAILAARASVNSQGEGYTPLHACAMFSRGNRFAAETARLLIQQRADVNAPAVPSGYFDLECRCARLVSALAGFENGSYVTRMLASIPGITPLGTAAFIGDEHLCQILLDHGADMRPNARGDTPETFAIVNRHDHLIPHLATFLT